MKPISAAEVRTGADYEAVRQQSRDRLAAAQADRRIQLGDDLALVFENRDTALASLEEALRAERTTDAEAVAAAAEAFSALLAPDGHLAATLYLDVADPATLTDRVRTFEGVAEAVFVEVGGVRVPARAEPDGELEAGATHLEFALDESLRRAWTGGAKVAIVVDHPAAHRRVELSAAQRVAVGAELGS